MRRAEIYEIDENLLFRRKSYESNPRNIIVPGEKEKLMYTAAYLAGLVTKNIRDRIN